MRSASRGGTTSRRTLLSVLVVDDDPAFAEMLTTYLSRDPEIQLVGVAGSLGDGLAMAKRHRPTVVVLDAHLPDGDAAVGAFLLGQLEWRPGVLVVSAAATTEEIASAMQAGAARYLPKERCIPAIPAAIRATALTLNQGARSAARRA
jgi:DNA-binding NarL/FixJ family response regulator